MNISGLWWVLKEVEALGRIAVLFGLRVET